jgi:hypothetical protein
MTTSIISHWITLLFFVNIIYCYGASILDSFVVYPGWKYLEPDQFLISHQKQSVWIIRVFVVPLVTATLLNCTILFATPDGISRWLIALSLACMIFNWFFSALVQIPIHRKLNQGLKVTLLDKVIYTNYFRVGVQTVQLGIVTYMMHIIL